ncbi:MAG TPA: M43 family zinc metalloprotease [Saprospiraceae bacterium]|nr:M43 family zinc metalloprotease [Saprospiraceae bacterium]
MVQIIAFGQGRKCKSPRINLQSQLRAESWAKQRSTVAVNKLIRVYFHIVRNTDGSQAAATIEDINNEFQDLIDDFDADNICFANVGFDFINNTAMNQSLDPDDEDDVAMLHPFLVPNCINIFYHQSLGEYGGNAYNIPNTFCSIDDGNIGLWSTISHEVGHCLGLLHTFSTATGEEYISGFNCALHGDRVCDTPADPYTEAACFSANNCNYTGNCEDPTGNTDYVPPYQNIMSYWGLGGCDPNHLTSGQFARVNSFLQTDLNLITTVSPATVGAGPGSFSSGYYFRTAHNSISINPSLNITGSTIASLQSKSVTCPPGFLIAPTSGSITIKATCDY